MSSALTYIILGTANFIGLQPVSNTPPGSIPSTVQEALQLQATRYNYTYTPGAGYHKIHNELGTWNMARRTCLDEGGHLAIINSAAEAQAIAQLLRISSSQWGHIGFHDLYEEGDYVTIHGESLAKAGYEGWHTGEPNNWNGQEHCGVLWSDGTLNDGRCGHRANFICELPQHAQQSPAPIATSALDLVDSDKA